MTDFDQEISRKHTSCVKWDSIAETYHAEDLLPLWVADMDFQAPKPVRDAFQQMIDHGIFGYPIPSDDLYQSVIDWEKKQHQVSLEKEQILFSSGVLPSLATAVQAFTEVGDSILIHDPVYPPFTSIVESNQRKIVRSPLLEKEGHFVMDLQDMETKIKENQVKMMILCNPHNPGGRVWSKDELQTLAELCKKYEVLLLSDEIHQDLVLFDNHFTSIYTLDPAFSTFTIAFTSATKTFNLAGIKSSMALIKDPDLREAFKKQQMINQHQEVNSFGLAGTQAAYAHGEEWLKELRSYLEENILLAENYFAEHLPQVRFMKPEGTYLVWLDFSGYAASDQVLQDNLIQKGKVVLNPGIAFGPAGHLHMRLNVACTKETLLDGLHRIKKACTE
ncbi:putative cystathionine beta-lyase PatB [Enterococcus faecalis 13-SD-W-01]|nr:putative cystathionine beta-lyase PatB [Enterococcus faecalis 13-SD-W-01]